MSDKIVVKGPYDGSQTVSLFINRAANSPATEKIEVDGFTNQVLIKYKDGTQSNVLPYEVIEDQY